MSNPFLELKAKTKKKELDIEEWGGQFSCSEYVDGKPCPGWAKVAKYLKREHILVWECQYGHRSYIEDVRE